MSYFLRVDTQCERERIYSSQFLAEVLICSSFNPASQLWLDIWDRVKSKPSLFQMNKVSLNSLTPRRIHSLLLLLKSLHYKKSLVFGPNSSEYSFLGIFLAWKLLDSKTLWLLFVFHLLTGFMIQIPESLFCFTQPNIYSFLCWLFNK